MIRFSLSCADGHAFDSWFQSSDAFEALKKSGHLACAICGSADVRKALMTPAVAAKGPDTAAERPLSQPSDPDENAIEKLRRQVEESSDYVGLSFASEARAMHDGDIPERPIYGEAKRDEARALIEDGIPVAPLPFMPTKKTN